MADSDSDFETSSPNNTAKNQQKINELINKIPLLGEAFDLECKIGEGTFSNVYLAVAKYKNEKGKKERFAIKHLVPTCHPSRVVRELKCMQEIGGKDNVVGVSMCLRVKDCIVFIMPYQQHDRFSNYVFEMRVEETKLYIKQLLKALNRVHQFGIIHRDVKPSNFLYSRREKKFLLVDFGLAQQVGEWDTENPKAVDRKRKRFEEGENASFSQSTKRQALQSINSNLPYSKKPTEEIIRAKDVKEKVFITPRAPCTRMQCSCDGKAQICHSCLTRKGQNAPRAGTPGFRPPEVLLKYPNQTTAVDMWAVGIIMLSILSRTYPFFKSPDDLTALAEVITVFGSDEIKSVAKLLGRNIICSETCKAINLKYMCQKLSERRLSKLISHQESKQIFQFDYASPHLKFPDSAYSLLGRLLDINPTKRITASQALEHPFITDN